MLSRGQTMVLAGLRYQQLGSGLSSESWLYFQGLWDSKLFNG